VAGDRSGPACYEAASPALAALLRDDFVQAYGRDLPAVVQCFVDDFHACMVTCVSAAPSQGDPEHQSLGAALPRGARWTSGSCRAAWTMAARRFSSTTRRGDAAEETRRRRGAGAATWPRLVEDELGVLMAAAREDHHEDPGAAHRAPLGVEDGPA
jgi:hypothetical protein